MSYENTLSSVLDTRLSRTIDTSFKNIPDRAGLWGYYGAFILGKESIITNKDLVINLTNFQNLSAIEFIYKIISLQIDNGYKFFILNIIPSLSGLYYFGLPKSESSFFYFNFVFIIFLNLLLLKIFLKNFKYIFKVNNIISSLFITSLISSIILILFFLYLGQIFFIIKLYISLGIVLFLYLIFDYSSNLKINKFYLFTILILIIYKFTSFNNGIGRIDALPSIIDINYKKNFSWKIDDINNLGCDKISNLIQKFNNEKIQWIKYNYSNIKFSKLNSSTDKPFNCYIKDGKHKFEISTKRQ